MESPNILSLLLQQTKIKNQSFQDRYRKASSLMGIVVGMFQYSCPLTFLHFTSLVLLIVINWKLTRGTWGFMMTSLHTYIKHLSIMLGRTDLLLCI